MAIDVSCHPWKRLAANKAAQIIFDVKTFKAWYR
jgi:hypothetical protein